MIGGVLLELAREEAKSKLEIVLVSHANAFLARSGGKLTSLFEQVGAIFTPTKMKNRGVCVQHNLPWDLFRIKKVKSKYQFQSKLAMDFQLICNHSQQKWTFSR